MKYDGSFSVEAACLMPLVLMCLFLPVGIGIQKHQEVIQWIESKMQAEKTDAIFWMYAQDNIKNMGEKNEN